MEWLTLGFGAFWVTVATRTLVMSVADTFDRLNEWLMRVLLRKPLACDVCMGLWASLALWVVLSLVTWKLDSGTFCGLLGSCGVSTFLLCAKKGLATLITREEPMPAELPFLGDDDE